MNDKVLFGMSVFTSSLFFVCMIRLCDSMNQGLIVGLGSILFLSIPLWMPKRLLECEK